MCWIDLVINTWGPFHTKAAPFLCHLCEVPGQRGFCEDQCLTWNWDAVFCMSPQENAYKSSRLGKLITHKSWRVPWKAQSHASTNGENLFYIIQVKKSFFQTVGLAWKESNFCAWHICACLYFWSNSQADKFMILSPLSKIRSWNLTVAYRPS